MPGEVLLLPLGVALARMLLHANAGSDAATLLGDAKDGWTALEKLRNRPRGSDAVGEAIATRLQSRLAGSIAPEELQNLRAAALDAAELLDRTTRDLEAVRSAAENPDDFLRYLYAHGGSALRKRMDSRSSHVFDQLLEAAAEEFTRLAPFSPRFASAAVIELLHRTQDLALLRPMDAKLSGIQEGIEDLRALITPAQGAIVLGTIPGRPATNIDRDELSKLHKALRVRGRAAVCAGGRGVGKSQLAASYARERVGQGCPLVAWINAETRESIITALAELAARVNREDPDDDPQRSAANALSYLNAYPDAGLVVLDNATEPTRTRDWIPTTGGCQVIITSTDREFTQLAVEVPVGDFTDEEARRYLGERTTLTEEGRELVAYELGNRPLALAAAASVIHAKRWTADRYLVELKKVDLDKALPQTADYPRTMAQAITLTIETVEPDTDAALVLILLSLLDVGGVSRELLTQLATSLRPTIDTDEVIATLTGASLASWAATGDDVVMHRLVGRVARDRAQARGNHIGNLMTVGALLASLVPGDSIRPSSSPEVARHILTLLDRLAEIPELEGSELQRAEEAAWKLGDYVFRAGDAGLQIQVRERLFDLNHRVLGDEHPDTLASRNNLAVAYAAVGRTADAIGLFEATLAERERLLGPEHPDTLDSRNNLAVAYGAVGRTADAIGLSEATLAAQERLLGPEHPATLGTRNNLANAYSDAGRTADAEALHLKG